MSDDAVIANAWQENEPLYGVVVVRMAMRHRPWGRLTSSELLEDESYLLQAFHYRIPEPLRGILQPGHLVSVPFGERRRPGVVVGIDTHSPVPETKDIERLIDPEPVLLPEQIELSRWISTYYLAPWYQVIWSMIPPGIGGQERTLLAAVPNPSPEALAALTPGQQAIWEMIREDGPLSLEQLARKAPFRTWRAMLNRLVSLGLVEKSETLSPPRVKPLFQEFIRLRPGISPADLPGDEAPRQRDVVDFLRSWAPFHGDPDGWMLRWVVQQETGASLESIRSLIQKGILESTQRQVWRDPLAGQAFVPVVPPRLTPDQEAIWRQIEADLQAPKGRPFLLQGVTGSGKTEIYLRAVDRVLAQGGGVIVLVPEIALSPQTVRRFGARHPTTIAVMHSEISEGERYDVWRRIRAGELRLVIGSRSAIFSPVKGLRLIVLDEEHERSYKQERTPRYHARQVALRLAEITGATVILGSATPSLESAYLAERGLLTRLLLPQRVMGHRRALEEQAHQLAAPIQRFRPAKPGERETFYADLPPVTVVDMRAELKAGNVNIFSRVLQEALSQTLTNGQQAILFINRRGAAPVVLCRDCGYVLKCRRCDVPLVYHMVGHQLVCHHCNLRQDPPLQCPNCSSPHIRYRGIGTQRVAATVRKMFPQARVIRWDYDETRRRRAHERFLDAFIRGEANVMVGTQMIAKGLDLPRVTLVGVVMADTLLNLPDFRAGERTFQLLTQVAGRAGRSVLGGQVIIQTYLPDHPAIQAASRHDYDAFYREEMAFRREHWYPPLSRLVRLLCVGRNEQQVEAEAEALRHLLETRIMRLGLPEIDLIGPAPAFYSRIRGQYRWHILVRGRDPAALLRDVVLPPMWRVDVDPEDLL